MSVALLDREMYTEAQAARLLQVPQPTLHWWLEGGKYGRKTYPPVIREKPTGTRVVNWAEFVEAGLLRLYRRDRKVELSELREVIEGLRTKFGVPYPLAHFRPFTHGRHLVWDLQQELGLPAEDCIVAVANDQMVLTGLGNKYVERVEWGDEVAEGWRPAADPSSPVIVRPDLRFGRPSVGGVSTEALWEQSESGDSVEEIADDFALTVGQVRWALSYEDGLLAQANDDSQSA